MNSDLKTSTLGFEHFNTQPPYQCLILTVGHAVAKATVMRLLALPRLPLPPLTDRSSLARNRLVPAGSFLLFSHFPVVSHSLSSSIS